MSTLAVILQDGWGSFRTVAVIFKKGFMNDVIVSIAAMLLNRITLFAIDAAMVGKKDL